MKVLVTGATGNVGEHVVRHLIDNNQEVVVATSSLDRKNKLKKQYPNVELLDFKNPTTFEQALKDVDRVFLMRPPHLGDPKDLYPFIDALKQHSIRFVVFLSLMGIEKNPIPPHYKIEKYIKESKIPYSFLRPGFFMQNLTGIHLHEIIHDQKLFVPAGHSKTSFVDAADVALAGAVLLTNPQVYQNTSFTITGSDAYSYDEVAQIMSEVTNINITYTKPSLLYYRKAMIQTRKLDKKFVNVSVALYIMTRLNTASKIFDDFKTLTNQHPTSLKAFIAKNKYKFQSS